MEYDDVLEPPTKYFCNNNHEAISVNNYDHIKQLRKSQRHLYKYKKIGLKTLKYLVENNLIYNDVCLFSILKKCNLDCIKYFEQNNINFIKEYPIIYGSKRYFNDTQNCLFALIDNNNYDVFEYVLSKYFDKININQVIQGDRTVLLDAIRLNMIDHIKLLLKYGARYDMLYGEQKLNLLQHLIKLNNLEFTDSNGKTFKLNWINYKTFEFIINNLNFDVNYYNKNGNNILMSALKSKDDKLIRLISDRYINKLHF